MSAALLGALAALVEGLDEDHACVASALSGRPSGLPVDPALAALHRELVVLRAREPDAPALHLLGAAAEPHGEAVQDHLTWLASRAAGDEVCAPAPVTLPLAC